MDTHYNRGVLLAFQGNLAQAAMDQGKLMEAIACYKKAIELHPEHTEVLKNLGRYRLENGELKEAETLLLRSIESRSPFANAHATLSAVCLKLGKTLDALSEAESAVRLSPGLPGATPCRN